MLNPPTDAGLLPAALGALGALLSAVATAFAAYATWKGPIVAARLAEEIRKKTQEEEQKHRMKLWVFTTLMQERTNSVPYSPDAVKAFNLIDLVFIESYDVRQSWERMFETFDATKHATELEKKSRFRELLNYIAQDIGIAGKFTISDFDRGYYPTYMFEEAQVQMLHRQNMLRQVSGQNAPAANTAPAQSVWPPTPAA